MMKTLTTKLPETLYRQVEQAAGKEHVSIDQFVMMALSAQVSAWITKDYLRERAERGSWEKFQQVLAKVPDGEPEDDDKL
jgi:hypothetical protein